VARVKENLPRGQLEGLPRREELEALVRYYHHLQNEHKRAPLESGVRRRIEERLLETRARFDRVLAEWVPEEELRRAWWEHLHNRAPAPPGPPAIRPLIFRGVSEVTGSVLEVRGKRGEELEVTVDGAPVERIVGEKDFASVTPGLSFRLDGNDYQETFSASAEALDALAGFLDNGRSPPWEHAAELLEDGLVDVHFGLTPRGKRALASRL
jgi:antitoxin (DNA-binding transcriptional repressor) of toxin-antitoxin stability system